MDADEREFIPALSSGLHGPIAGARPLFIRLEHRRSSAFIGGFNRQRPMSATPGAG
jgi:hypothetical protein